MYASRRGPNLDAALTHQVPDSGLYGQNYLQELGIDARIHIPRYQWRTPEQRPARAAALAEQFVLPWSVGADVIFTPTLGAVPVSSRLAGRVGRARVVLFNLNLSARYAAASPRDRVALRLLMHGASAVVCPSEAQRLFLLSEVGLPADRVETALAGVDTEFFRPEPLPHEGYVLAIGRDRGRDWGTLFEALAGIDRRTVLVTSARNLAGLDVPSGVEVLLDASPRRLPELYAGAACVVVPTRGEAEAAGLRGLNAVAGLRGLNAVAGCDCSGQTVLLEAMASGRPVVATARASLRDYVEDGKTAVIVPVADPPALRAALVRVLADSDLAASLATEAHRVAASQFSSRRFAQRLAPILHAVGSR